MVYIEKLQIIKEFLEESISNLDPTDSDSDISKNSLEDIITPNESKQLYLGFQNTKNSLYLITGEGTTQ